MKQITLSIPDKVFNSVITRLQASGITMEEYAASLLVESVRPRTVTIKDIAAMAAVSAQAVSFALHNSSQISAETKKRILASAKKLGYVPSFSARNLRKKRDVPQ